MITINRLIVPVILATASSVAVAESGHWYLGLGYGEADYQDWTSRKELSALGDEFGTRLGVDDFDGSRSADLDDSDSGFKLFGGYCFNEYFGLELAYMDLGEVQARTRASGTFYDEIDNDLDGDLVAEASAEVTAFSLDVQGRLPLAKGFFLMAEAGLYNADVDLSVGADSSISSSEFNYEESENSVDFH